MSTIENFVLGVRMAEGRARKRREETDQRIAKDIEIDPHKSATLRGVTQIANEANHSAQATLDSLLGDLFDLLKMLDEKKGADDAEAK